MTASSSRPRNARYSPSLHGPGTDIADDCRHYLGDRPCKANRLCRGCESYAPLAHRICIIKLGALGDVIRTLCILPSLHERYGDAHITWVSKANGCRMIAGHPQIDRVLEFDALTAMTLAAERFDVVINLDKEPQPCGLAAALFARTKLGVIAGPSGRPVPANAEAAGYFKLGLSDELKFHCNSKGYPQLVHEALGLPWTGHRYELTPDADDATRVRAELRARGWRDGEITLGVNVGAATTFANKMWPADRIAATLRALRRRGATAQVMLLGGPAERETIAAVRSELARSGDDAGVIDAGTEHSEQAFVAVVDACDVVLAGDTMAMHVAIALGKHVVAFFGPTCEQEIDLFGRGEKLIAATPCSPCYKRICDHDDACLAAVSAAQAVDALLRALRAAQAAPTVKVMPLPVLRKVG